MAALNWIPRTPVTSRAALPGFVLQRGPAPGNWRLGHHRVWLNQNRSSGFLFWRVFFTRTGIHPGSSPGQAFARKRSRKRCAAQAEYARLAAQAYSPSDAMSQAKIGLDGLQKVQRLDANFAKRGSGRWNGGLAANVSVARAGWSSRFFPVVGDLAASPHAAGSFGLRARSSGLAAGILAAAPAGAAGATPDALDEAVATGGGFGTVRPAWPARGSLPVPAADWAASARRRDGRRAAQAFAGLVGRGRRWAVACSNR